MKTGKEERDVTHDNIQDALLFELWWDVYSVRHRCANLEAKGGQH